MTGIALVLSLVSLAPGDLNGSLETFPIGFWNYAPIEVFDEAKIQEWQDAGVTLTMGPEFVATSEDIAHMKQVLDWAHERGIQVIVCDPRTRARSPLPGEFATGVEKAVEDFGAHPATWGFHVLDEPEAAQFEATCQAVRIVKEAAPGLQPFVNLLPWYNGVLPRVGRGDWASYLDEFLAESGMEFICYDCYVQMNPGQSGWPMYFRNLNEYREAARRKGVPFWTTILSVGHFHYRCPSEDDLRWQFNTSVAYGAQGILYFFFYMRYPHGNYRLSPIDEFWDRTATFEAMKRVNKGFVKRYGRLFLDLEFVRAMQWPEPVMGCDPFEPGTLVTNLTASGHESEHPVILTRFRDKQERAWLALVNNATEGSCHASITLAGPETKVYTLNWDGEEVPFGVQRGPDHVVIGHWLAPGQMEVFRVEPAAP